MKKSRRKFLKNSAKTSLGLMIVPRHVLGGKGYVPPSDRLNIAIVGAGGQGTGHVKGVKKSPHNLIGLCDVDKVKAADVMKANKKVDFFTDWRKMYDQLGKKIDAVMIATPDHNHAAVGLPAMNMGKHVYIEKPLAHNIYEARMLTEAARKNKVITQMGNQGSSGEGIRLVKEWVDAGTIGKVKKVHVWTNRPIWPQGVPTPTEKVPIPDTLDWDMWQGPALERNYNPAFLPFKWRGWWDYGTGALGDMGCHLLDVVHYALELPYPNAAEASVAQVYIGDFHEADYQDSCPPASKVHIHFPATDKQEKIELIWYDGGITPPRPEELKSDEPFGTWDGGCLMEGTDGKLTFGVYGENPALLPSERMKDFTPPDPTIPRIKGSHRESWWNAIVHGGPAPTSNFDFSGPLTEIVLMGNLAIRSFEMKKLKPGKKPGWWAPYDYPGRTKLEWDGENMEVTNFKPANQFVKRAYREGWEI